MGMTKFESEDDPGFRAITGELRRWIRGLTVIGTAQALRRDRSEETTQVERQHGTHCTYVWLRRSIEFN